MSLKTQLSSFLAATVISAGVSHAALVVNPPMTINRTLTINPIIVSDNAGNNTANFMGSASQEAEIKAFVDTIWAQAGIDVEWLAPQTINNTEILDGSEGPNGNAPRPTSDLSGDAGGIDHATLGSSVLVSSTLNIFFVNIPAGFSAPGPNSAAGLAETPGDIISMFVGGNLLGFEGGREVIASVLAHEIGHNLSLPHHAVSEGLMYSDPTPDPSPGERLSSAEIASALASGNSRGLFTLVPEPSSLAMMGIACLTMVVRRKRA